jgi:hypothetical protein
MIKVNRGFHFRTGLVLGALMLLATVPGLALAQGGDNPTNGTVVSLDNPDKQTDFIAVIPLTQTDPGTNTQPFLSFVDADGNGLPDDLNGDGILGQPGLPPAGDQLYRIDRLGQSFDGAVDQVTALTRKGEKVAQNLTGAGVTITFNSAIFIGPEITPGVHAIFGQATGTAGINKSDGKGSLAMGYYGALTGTMDLLNGTVVVAYTRHCWAIGAEGALNSVKSIKGDFSALAAGPVGNESAVLMISGAAQ